MSNICGMDGNYCSSCAKDRRIAELKAKFKMIVEDWEECSEVAPCPTLGYEMKQWCPYCIAVAALGDEDEVS